MQNMKYFNHFQLKNIVILNHEDGSPYLNDEDADISIAHDGGIAIAFVYKK